MREKEREAWLKTALAPGLDAPTLVRLLQALGDPELLLHADYAAVSRAAGDAAARALRAVDDDRVAEASAWLGRTPDAFLLPIVDDAYPAALIEAGVAPPVLFGRGNRAVLQEDALWITGMTHADAEALRDAREMGAAAARAGLVVTTTLADGIEAEAAQGVLDAGGRLLVWFATGPNRVFPKSNLETVRRALATGSLILTPHPPGEAVSEAALGLRTACAAAYARGILVVADERRGRAVEAARQAAQIGRDVFAVPGSIHAVGSKGPHQLIREGAKLAESVLDLLDEWSGRHNARLSGGVR